MLTCVSWSASWDFVYEYSVFHLKLLTTTALLMIEVTFRSSIQALMPEGLGWYVEKTESNVSGAEFCKHHVLSIEVSGLMSLP